MKKLFISLLVIGTLVALTWVATAFVVRAQPFLGLKGGVLLNRMQYKDRNYLKENDYKSVPYFGYTAGIIFHYRVSKRWSLHTELNYATKGRVIRRTGIDFVYDKHRYQYLELPILFRFTFGNRDIKGYVNAGPNVGYLLLGRGTFSSPDQRLNSDELQYNYLIANPERRDNVVPISNVQFLQIGLEIGAGIALPIVDQRKLVFFDFRYTLLQSHLGRNSNITTLAGYVENYEGAPHAIAATIGFVFGFSEVSIEY